MRKTITPFILIIPIVFLACKKENSLPERFTPNPGTNSNVKFLNMSPGAASVNFFANGIKISAATPGGTNATVVTGLTYPALFPSTIGYATLPAGSTTIDVKVPDSAAVMPGATVLSSIQSLASNKFYTFVLLDTVIQAKVLLVEDDPSVADQTKAYVRMANFNADSAIAIRVLKTSADYPYSKTYPNVTPKSVLEFDSLGAGTGQVYSITFMRASNSAVIGTITNFAPSRTKKYTLYLRGNLRYTGGVGFGLYTNF